MSGRAYIFRRPDYWRDHRYLRLALLSLVREYDGLPLDLFVLDNMAFFGWRTAEVERAVYELVARRILRVEYDVDGQVVANLPRPARETASI